MQYISTVFNKQPETQSNYTREFTITFIIRRGIYILSIDYFKMPEIFFSTYLILSINFFNIKRKKRRKVKIILLWKIYF